MGYADDVAIGTCIGGGPRQFIPIGIVICDVIPRAIENPSIHSLQYSGHFAVIRILTRCGDCYFGHEGSGIVYLTGFTTTLFHWILITNGVSVCRCQDIIHCTDDKKVYRQRLAAINFFVIMPTYYDHRVAEKLVIDEEFIRQRYRDFQKPLFDTCRPVDAQCFNVHFLACRINVSESVRQRS